MRQMGRSRGVLLTSYSAMTSHKELLVEQDWHYVILDEGHKIRNPDAQITLAVKQVGPPWLVNGCLGEEGGGALLRCS